MLYPSCFYYPGEMGREQVKSAQLTLASYISRFFPVEYADFEHLIGRPQTAVQIRRFERQVREYLGKKDFDILAISCWTSLCYQATMMTARIARELYPKRLIIVGGYHPTARPQDFVAGDNIFDYVIRGEGEVAMKQVAESFSTAGRPGQTQIITSPPLQPDDYVHVNWELVDSIIESNFPEGLNTLVVYLSRGCPFNCSFCMETLKNRQWRPFPVDRAIAQIEQTAERYKFIGLGIGDACFGVRPRWRKEFLSRLADLKPDYWVLCETRPEYLDEDDIELMGRIKFQVQLGIESCSLRMLSIMNKSKQPQRFLDNFRRVSRLMTEHGIVHGANLVFNHPGETEETLKETFDFVDAEIARGPSALIWTCHSYTHFPGSEVDLHRGDYEQKYGAEFLCPEWWLEEENQYVSSRRVVPSGGLRGEKLNLWMTMLRDRDQQLRENMTPTAFRLAASTVYPHWRTDPRYDDSAAM